MRQLFLIFIFFVSVARSQNLVPNWSFENYTSCPNSSSQLQKAIPWFGPTINSSDYYNSCAPWPYNVPKSTGVGFQYAKHGNAYAGFYFLNGGFGTNYREYTQVLLTDTLTGGKCYYAEFFANLENGAKFGCNNVAANFSWVSYGGGPIPFGVPQHITRYGNPIIKDTLNWVQVAGIYLASGGEQFITIGNFRNDTMTNTLVVDPIGSSSAYYLVDAVSVYSINPTGTLPWTYRDTTVNFGDSVYIGNYLGGGFTSNWYLQGGGFINSGSGIYVKPSVTSNYIVQFTLCGVPRADTLKVTVNYVGIQELGVRSWELVVSPNPNNGLLTIEILNKEFILQESELRIVTVLGQEVKKEKLFNKKQTLNISELNNGIYYLQLFQNDKLMLTKKIIKQ